MPAITLPDISLKEEKNSLIYDLNEKNKKYNLTKLRETYFKAKPEICTERAGLLTEYHLKNKLLDKKKISILDKAKAYRYVLENKKAIVRHKHGYRLKDEKDHTKGMKKFDFNDTSLFAGSTTGKFKGVPLYPEFMALTLWPELWSIGTRDSNPLYITDEDVKKLNNDIFPPWIKNSIFELARKRAADEDTRNQIKLFENLVFFTPSKVLCISHTVPDFSVAINQGLREIINEAEEKKNKTKKKFYKAVTEVLEGIITYSKNLAVEADKLAGQEKDPDLKKELHKTAEIYRHVPEYPARTFREGLTTVWICWVAIHLENANAGLSLGRLDQILYDLYRKDIDSGNLTEDEAIELICYLWLKIGDHVPYMPNTGEQLFGGTGSNQAITIGGVDKEGGNAVNDLTYILLKATELMKLRDPNLNARYYHGINSEEYLKRLCEVNVNTGATPALHNDKAVIKALTKKGDTLEEARDYAIIGCAEPGSNGRFYGHTGALLLNLTCALELTMYNGRHRHTNKNTDGRNPLISMETGNPAYFANFNEFKEAFEKQTRWLIDQAVGLNNHLGKTHQDYYPTPILSSFFEGPMDKGKDLVRGGAKINSSGLSIIGLADVADSLSAVEEIVFNTKNNKVTFDQLLVALDKNFGKGKKSKKNKAYQALRCRLMDHKLKYGNDEPGADANVKWITGMIDEAASEKKNYRGGHYRVGYWSMTYHAGFGKLTGALPNGREKGENLASGITPVSGVTPSLCAALNSVAKIPAKCLSNGVALNLKYTPETENREAMLKNFAASVKAYFDDDKGKRDGGMEIQFNVTGSEDLRKALKKPDPELLVRVSGYTAYFKDLNPQMKEEIIERTEYRLSTGKAVNLKPLS